MTIPPLNRDAVAAEADTVLNWQHKAVPPAWWGSTIADVRAKRPRLSQFTTPLVTLSGAALDHNRATMARWCADRGLALAPHGKTTMAPALWQDQLDAGAWGITVANPAQLAVAQAFGVARTMIANTVVAAPSLSWIADRLDAHPDHEIVVWADSLRAVELMHEALSAHGAVRPLPVLVEHGAVGGRTGVRDRAAAVEVAAAVAASRRLSLAGVAGYEGAVAHHPDAASRRSVRTYLDDLVGLHNRLTDMGVYERHPIVSAGGSAYFDVVADVLAPLRAHATVMLRSGAYLTHDDGFYRHISPLGADPRTTGPTLRAGLHGWVRVSSRPEPGLAIVDAGKRDLPFDEGLPTPQRLAGEPLEGATVTALNDQHAFVSFDPRARLEVGDVLRLGLSHPCTTFDKWNLLPIVDDADADDPVVCDMIRTWF